MNRWTSLGAAVLLLGATAPSRGQFGGGGFGGGQGGMMGGRPINSVSFGSAGAFSPGKVELASVKLAWADGKSMGGSLNLTSVVVGVPAGIYEIKPTKVREIRFGTPQSMGSPTIIGASGAQRSGQVITTTGEVIDGVVWLPEWWRIETDLGSLKPSPEGIRSITFDKPAEATQNLEPIPPPRDAAESPPPPTGGTPPPVLPTPTPTEGTSSSLPSLPPRS